MAWPWVSTYLGVLSFRINRFHRIRNLTIDVSLRSLSFRSNLRVHLRLQRGNISADSSSRITDDLVLLR